MSSNVRYHTKKEDPNCGEERIKQMQSLTSAAVKDEFWVVRKLLLKHIFIKKLVLKLQIRSTFCSGS